jgi:hypothetical protein
MYNPSGLTRNSCNVKVLKEAGDKSPGTRSRTQPDLMSNGRKADGLCPHGDMPAEQREDIHDHIA